MTMNSFKTRVAVYVRFGLLPLMIVLLSITNPDFLSIGNLSALGQTFAVIAPVALGIGLTMIAGELDLSVGAMVAFSGLIMVQVGGQSPALGLGVTIGVGALLGAVNAYLTLILEVSSLVTTLGVMIVLQGAAVWLEGGRTAIFDNPDLTDFAEMAVMGVFSPRSLVAIALVLFVTMLMGFTRLGRDIYAVGSSRKAAIMSGVRVRASIFTVFILSGAFAALDGALMAVSLGRASSQFGGSLLIQAVTAAILGGVALSGGVGRALGIAVGALTLSVLSNGLSLAGADSSTILLLNGGVLLAVVLVESDLTEHLFRWMGRGLITQPK
jgi:ribose/xylose/arabinose/galactoside ABC-type transport system permease subunit